MNITVGSGNARKTVSIKADRDCLRKAANEVKTFLFRTNADYHKAKRRGDRALGVA